MGKIEVKEGHILLNKSCCFGISSFMQQHMCFMGQLEVFEDASESFRRMTGVKVSTSQLQRVCHYYGQQLEDQQQKAIVEGGKDKKVVHKERSYAMLDGGMILTREDKWKEMKLARLFDASQTTQVSKDRGHIGSSTYIAHLGNHKAFLKKVE